MIEGDDGRGGRMWIHLDQCYFIYAVTIPANFMQEKEKTFIMQVKKSNGPFKLFFLAKSTRELRMMRWCLPVLFFSPSRPTYAREARVWPSQNFAIITNTKTSIILKKEWERRGWYDWWLFCLPWWCLPIPIITQHKQAADAWIQIWGGRGGAKRPAYQAADWTEYGSGNVIIKTTSTGLNAIAFLPYYQHVLWH